MSATTPERESVISQLTEIFRSLFDDPQITLYDTMTAKDVKDWDSLNHINLIVATEKTFGIKFKTAEIAKLANVGQFIDTILQKMASK